MSKLKIGDKAIDFILPAVDGKNYSLKMFDDKKAVAVIFVCNHCPYVLAWEKRLIELQNKFTDKGVSFTLICSNDSQKYPDDGFEKMKAHAFQRNYPFPYLRDESQEVARKYGALKTPEIFLFDADRKLCYHGAPDDNYEDADSVEQNYFRDAITAILEGKTVPIPETPPLGCTIKWKPVI